MVTLFSKIAPRDPFSNDDMRARVAQFFATISDEAILKEPEETLFQRAFEAAKMRGFSLSEDPQPTFEEDANLSSDVITFAYTMSGNHEILLNRMGIIPERMPQHRVEGAAVLLWYPAINPKTVAENHARDITAIRDAVSRVEKAICGYNGMVDTEIRSTISRRKERAERRQEFLQGMQ